MNWVNLQPRAYVWPSQSPAPLLDAERMREFTAHLSDREASTVAMMVDGELRRYGYRFVQPGRRLWNAAEERVVADMVGLELDLGEIGWQIEEAMREAELEARWEASYSC